MADVVGIFGVKHPLFGEDSPILGVSEIGRGRVAVYGDSNCIDSSHMVTNCFGLLLKILDFTARNIKQPALFSDSARDYSSLYGRRHPLPSRRPDINFSAYSSVLGNRLLCGSDSRLEISGTKGFTVPGYPSTRLSSTPLNISLQQPTHNNHPLLSNTHFSFLYRDDEVDPSVPLTRHWLVLPVLVAVFGMMLLFSFFRFRLRRPRRRKVFFNG